MLIQNIGTYDNPNSSKLCRMTTTIQNEIQKTALCDAAKNAVLPRFPRLVTQALILFEKHQTTTPIKAEFPNSKVESKLKSIH